jgi:hypothetical protein
MRWAKHFAFGKAAVSGSVSIIEVNNVIGDGDVDGDAAAGGGTRSSMSGGGRDRSTRFCETGNFWVS